MRNRRTIKIFTAALCMIVLVLDSRTAIDAMKDGIQICISTLIPSLFPFFVFSNLLVGSLSGRSIGILRPFARLCRIPYGSESLLAIGFLGGYPTGAQNVALAYRREMVTLEESRRMVVFCNNAGPAFIFGFLGQLFQNPFYPWLLWLIHISSALLTGCFLPGGTSRQASIPKANNISFSDAVDISIRTMARVCSWVLLFRILLQFLRRWFLWFCPPWVQIMLTGILELSNGCLMLNSLPNDASVLICGATALGFGGFCVYLQTASITNGISMALYLPGKILQGCISFLISYVILLPLEDFVFSSPAVPCIVLGIAVITVLVLQNIEKPVAFSEKLLYNFESYEKRREPCCFGRKSKNPASTVSTVPN